MQSGSYDRVVGVGARENGIGQKNLFRREFSESSRNTAGSMRRLKAAFSNSIETPKVDSQIGQDGEIFPPSPS